MNPISKAVILAAGRGKRMMPLTAETPKPLLRFRGKTLLDHIFDELPEEIEEVVLVVHYLAEKIKAYCGDIFHGRKIYYAEGSEKGNAIGFLAAKPFFKEGERFFVVYADDLIPRSDFEKCLKYEYSWLCVEVENPKLAGIAEIAEDLCIKEVEEKPQNPKSNWAAAGAVVVNTDIFDYTPDQHANGEYYFSSMMNKFLKDHAVHAVKTQSTWPHFNTMKDLDS